MLSSHYYKFSPYFLGVLICFVLVCVCVCVCVCVFVFIYISIVVSLSLILYLIIGGLIGQLLKILDHKIGRRVLQM